MWRLVEKATENRDVDRRHVARDREHHASLRVLEQREQPRERSFRTGIVVEEREAEIAVGRVRADEHALHAQRFDETSRARDDRLALVRVEEAFRDASHA